MRNLRAGVKLFLLFFWSLAFVPFCLAGVLFRCFCFGSWLLRQWGKGTLWIIGAKVGKDDTSTPVSGKLLIVANHQSYLDIMICAAFLGARFTPDAGIRRWPVVGFLTSLTFPVWIDRGNRMGAGKAVKMMAAALEENIPLLVYPEGGNGSGDGIRKLKSSCFASALESGADILPVVICYHAPADGTKLQWNDNTPFLTHFWRVLGLKEFYCRMYIMDKMRFCSADRRELAEQVHAVMTDCYLKWRENA